MAFDYSNLVTVAKTLLKDFGRPVTLSKNSRVAADSSKPWRGSSAADVSTSVTAVVVPNVGVDVEGQGIIRRFTARAFVSASEAGAAEIETYDSLTDGAKIWNIESVQVMQPGATRIVYILTLTE